MRGASIAILLGTSLAGLAALGLWLDGRAGGEATAAATPVPALRPARGSSGVEPATAPLPAMRAAVGDAGLEGEHVIVGRCLDFGRRPLEGVLVRGLGPLSGSATSDAAGRFELPFDAEWVEEWARQLELSPPEKRMPAVGMRSLIDATRAGRRVPALELSLRGQATRTLRLPCALRGRVVLGALPMQPGGTLRGRVIAADRSPVSGATLAATGEFPGGLISRSTRTDAAGYWELSGLRYGPYALRAGWLGAWEAESLQVQLNGRSVHVGDVTLAPVDEERVARARVYGLDGRRAAGVVVRFEGRGYAPIHEGTFETDSEGRAALLGEVRQSYTLSATDLRTGARSEEVRAVCGEPEVTLRLQPPEPVPLYVKNEKGRTLRKFSCLITDPAEPPDPAEAPPITSHPKGLVFVPVSERPVTLTISAVGFETLVVPELTLRPLIADGADEKPPAPFRVERRRRGRITTLGSAESGLGEKVYTVRLTRAATGD